MMACWLPPRAPRSSCSLLCGFVGWLLHSRRIPNETATVLSKVRHLQPLHQLLFSLAPACGSPYGPWSMVAVGLVVCATDCVQHKLAVNQHLHCEQW